MCRKSSLAFTNSRLKRPNLIWLQPSCTPSFEPILLFIRVATSPVNRWKASNRRLLQGDLLPLLENCHNAQSSKNKILLSAEKTILINIDIFHWTMSTGTRGVCVPVTAQPTQPHTAALPWMPIYSSPSGWGLRSKVMEILLQLLDRPCSGLLSEKPAGWCAPDFCLFYLKLWEIEVAKNPDFWFLLQNLFWS